MATYVIVDNDKNPLEPGEINASTDIAVSDGDIFIVDSSVDTNVSFSAAGDAPVSFDVQFVDTNANAFTMAFAQSLTPTVTINDNVDLRAVSIDARHSDGINFDAGDNVSFGQFWGSAQGQSSIAIGNGFTTEQEWRLGNANDQLTVGNDATFRSINAGSGDDTVIFGDRANVGRLGTFEGDDSVTFGDGLMSQQVMTGSGNDTVQVGESAQVGIVDGGDGWDELTTATEGIPAQNFERTNFVCYAMGTMIDTPNGPRAVELLRDGDVVNTLDNGPQHIRWIRQDHQPLLSVERNAKPILIAAGALGAGLPAQDLIVSPQHRILVGGGGQLQERFETEAFAPAKSLTKLRGIRHMAGKRSITWVHFACDRHEIVLANGCLSESLLLGPMALQGLTKAEHMAITRIFGTAGSPGGALNGPPARKCLPVGKVRRLLKVQLKKADRAHADTIERWKAGSAMGQCQAAAGEQSESMAESGGRNLKAA